MALQLSTTLTSGVSADYYKIANYIIDMEASTVTIQVNLYVNSSAYSGGNAGVSSKIYIAKLTDASTIINSSAHLTACYTFLKAQSDFSGATDLGGN